MEQAQPGYFEDIASTFRMYKRLAEQAVEQLPNGDAFFRSPSPQTNSIAVIIKHVAGNLRSRWTDFLTTDGEKPDRLRDSEFVITPNDTRARLMEAWDEAFAVVFATIGGLTAEDLSRIVRIRDEPFSVVRAIHRSITHTSYHVGQIVYLSRMQVNSGWKWLTIPPGESEQYRPPLSVEER